MSLFMRALIMIPAFAVGYFAIYMSSGLVGVIIGSLIVMFGLLSVYAAEKHLARFETQK